MLNFMIQIWWQWMESMFWQVGLLILLVTLIDKAIRRWAWPQVRYVLWGLVFLKLVIPPTWQMPTSIVSWIRPGVEQQISIQIETVETADNAARSSDLSTPIQRRQTDSSGKSAPIWQTVLFISWIAGMAVYALTIIIRMARLRKKSYAMDGNLPEWFHELLADTAQRLKLKKIPAVYFRKNATGPAVFGLFKPALLLPVGYLEKLSKQEATHVLLHELCHLKRGDLVLHWFTLLLQVVYWFNPLLLWTRRQMRHVCEICCDLSVAGILREKTPAYRSTLLNSARELLSETVDSSLGFLGIFEDPFRLVSRLKWLEKNTWEKPAQKTVAIVFTLLVMVFCVMPMHGYSQPPAMNESLPVQPNNTAGNVESEKPQTPNSPRVTFLVEMIVLEVTDDTDFDIECPEIEKVQFQTGGICHGVTIEGEHYPDLETASQGLENIPGVKIVSKPIILTLNNRKASIKQGYTVGLQTEPEPLLEDHDLLLEITPQLLENDQVNQHILVERTEGISTQTLESEFISQEGDILTIRIPSLESAEEATSGESPCRYIFVSSRILAENGSTSPQKGAVGREGSPPI
jgi:beta-lactamase regulating signal transducer with metallopeptidase domain